MGIDPTGMEVSGWPAGFSLGNLHGNYSDIGGLGAIADALASGGTTGPSSAGGDSSGAGSGPSGAGKAEAGNNCPGNGGSPSDPDAGSKGNPYNANTGNLNAATAVIGGPAVWVCGPNGELVPVTCNPDGSLTLTGMGAGMVGGQSWPEEGPVSAPIQAAGGGFVSILCATAPGAVPTP